MGAAVGIAKAFSCQDCARFVCNSMHIRSSCCQGGCEMSYDTDLVELPRDDTEYSVEVDGCCEVGKHHNNKE